MEEIVKDNMEGMNAQEEGAKREALKAQEEGAKKEALKAQEEGAKKEALKAQEEGARMEALKAQDNSAGKEAVAAVTENENSQELDASWTVVANEEVPGTAEYEAGTKTSGSEEASGAGTKASGSEEASGAGTKASGSEEALGAGTKASETEEISGEGAETSEAETEALDEAKMVSAIEAILFAMGSAVEIPRIASTLGLDVRKTKALIMTLSEKYESKDSGLMVAQFENAVQLCTKPDQYEYLIKIAKAPRKYVLSESVMETLSIVAYKQPVTKAEIEKIRGVSCEHAINKLVEFDLVEEVGRLDAPGRPLLFGTTEQFLRSFGVKSLEDLPLAGTDAVETFREQAEQEAQLKLDI